MQSQTDRQTKVPILLQLLCFFILSFSAVGQQQNLIQEDAYLSTGIHRNHLSTSEFQAFQRIISQGMYTDYYAANFGSLAQLQSNGKISVSLPDDGCGDLIFRAFSIEYQNEQNYRWYGELLSPFDSTHCNCLQGSIVLVSSQYGKMGHITVDDKTYELLQIGTNKYILGKLDESKFTESECSVDETNSAPIMQNDTPPPTAQTRGVGNCDVRCLVLYSDNALQAEGSVANINNRVNLAIEQTNQALMNSDIESCDLKIELVGVEALNFTETDYIRADLDKFLMNKNVQSRRDDFEADIVILLTDGNYTGFGRIFGIVPKENVQNNNVQNNLAEDFAYSIVETTSATGKYTLAHEVAHLFGGGHQNDPRPGIPHGHKFKTGKFLPCIFGKRQYTILHTLSSAGGTRIPHYSNPGVIYDGKQTGWNKRNNARQLLNTACTVAQYRTTIQPAPNVDIVGDLETCPCSGASLQSRIYGGKAGLTFTYHWESSDDGINWTTISTNSAASIPATKPPHHCEEEDKDVVFVRLSVTDSDGNIHITNESVRRTLYDWPGQDTPCYGHPIFKSKHSDRLVLSLAPNPSKGTSNIILNVPAKGTYSISVLGTQGNKVAHVLESQNLDVGTYTYPLNIAQKGLYFIQSTDNKGNHTISKFIKL